MIQSLRNIKKPFNENNIELIETIDLCKKILIWIEKLKTMIKK